MTNDELLHKWVNNTISAEELILFQSRPEYGSLIELYEKTEGLKGPTLDGKAMLETILATPKVISGQLPKSSTPKTISFPSFWKLGIAASFLLVVGYFTGQSLKSKDTTVNYAIAIDQKVEGTFPDQSTFALVGDSKLSYDGKTWEAERKVTLEGEAFFKVEKGASFLVHTPTGIIQVLGTQFNVISRGDQLEVSCTEGKVRVHSPSSANYNETLLLGESMVLNLKGMSKTRKKDITKLRKVKLSEVVQELAQKYAVEISYDGLDASEMLTCNFRNDNLELALKTSLSPLGINFVKEEENKVRLTN